MRHLFSRLMVLLLPLTFALQLAAPQAEAAGKTIRMALGDIESVETLNLLVAIEHAKQRGLHRRKNQCDRAPHRHPS